MATENKGRKRNKQLAKLDSRPELTIGEPILASTWVTVRHPIRSRFLGGIVGAVTDGFAVVSPLISLAQAGAETGWDFAKEKLYAPKKIRLRPEMYMVLGPTTFALYELTTGLTGPAIGKTILYLPRRAVVGLEIDGGRGKRQRLIRRLTLRLVDGRTIQLADRRRVAQGASEGLRDEILHPSPREKWATAAATEALSARAIQARDERARRVVAPAMLISALAGLIAGLGLLLPWFTASLSGADLPGVNVNETFGLFDLFASASGYAAAIPWLLALCAVLVVVLGVMLVAAPKSRQRRLYNVQGVSAAVALVVSYGVFQGLSGPLLASNIASHLSDDPYTTLRISEDLSTFPGAGAFVTMFGFLIAAVAAFAARQYFDQAAKARQALASAATRKW